MWPEDVTLKYLAQRIRIQQDARVALPFCSREERWQKDATWAVVKDGNKRASKLCRSLEEAEAVIGEAPKFHIDFRPGVATRCEQYCSVRDQCRALADGQWAEGETEGDEVTA